MSKKLDVEKTLEDLSNDELDKLLTYMLNMSDLLDEFDKVAKDNKAIKVNKPDVKLLN